MSDPVLRVLRVTKVLRVPRVPRVLRVLRIPRVLRVLRVPKVLRVPSVLRVPRVPRVSRVPRVLRVLRVPRVSRVPRVPSVLRVNGLNIAIYEKFVNLDHHPQQTNVKDRDQKRQKHEKKCPPRLFFSPLFYATFQYGGYSVFKKLVEIALRYMKI